MTSRFRLLREYDESYQTERAEVFAETMRSGLVPLWEAVGVYDCLYDSDGKEARDVSRELAYGLDRLHTEAGLARLLPPAQGASIDDAIEFLDKVLKACTRHPSARIETN